MAKRFTDSAKWDDPWFYELKPIDKLFWLYILDKCDHAGLWKVSWSPVKHAIGAMPDLACFSDRIVKVTPELFFIPKFLIFQYGADWVNSKARAKESAIACLEARGLLSLALDATRQRSNGSYPTQQVPA